MHMSALAKSLRLNHDEVIRRWMDNLHGHIADDFEEMLQTPMGNGVAGKLLGQGVVAWQVRWGGLQAHGPACPIESSAA